MYIKVMPCTYIATHCGGAPRIYGWRNDIFAANHVPILWSCNYWMERSEAVRAAKKMAKKLGIEYREN